MCIFTLKTLRDFSKTEPNCQILSKLQFGQTHTNQLRIILRSSICIIYSKGEKSFCTSHKHNCYQETVCLLAYKDFEHKGEGSQGVFKGCNEFTRIVKNLKWVT